MIGVGVGGTSSKKLDAVLAPKGLADPKEERLPAAMAFCSRGLAAAGEYGEPLRILSEAELPFAELLKLRLLAAEPARDGVLEYRGGVL